MSHQNKKSLIGQADDRLQKMTQTGVGRSKHQDKIDDADLITFCRCTGLRRAELQDLRYDDFRLAAPDGSAGPGLYVHRSTKGGRVRRINFVGSKDEIALCCDIMSKGNGLT